MNDANKAGYLPAEERNENHLSHCAWKSMPAGLKGFILKREMLKLLTENILEEKIGKNFLTRTPIAQQTAPRTDRWNYIKCKGLSKRNC